MLPWMEFFSNFTFGLFIENVFSEFSKETEPVRDFRERGEDRERNRL